MFFSEKDESKKAPFNLFHVSIFYTRRKKGKKILKSLGGLESSHTPLSAGRLGAKTGSS